MYKFYVYLIFLFQLLAQNTLAAPILEINKTSCRWFYHPDNTYTINYYIQIKNVSTAGEIIRNINVNDNLVTTFGGSSNIISASITDFWGDQGTSGQPFNWDWTNITNWNGVTTTNVLNDGTYTLNNLWLYPTGELFINLCVRVRAGNPSSGIGSGVSYTNTTSLVSAQTTTGGSVSTTGTMSVTLAPIRSRSILAGGMFPQSASPGNTNPYYNYEYLPSVNLDGTYNYVWYLKLKNFPFTSNPDGANGTATGIDTYFDLAYGMVPNGVNLQSLSITKIYGPASMVANPNYTANFSTINGLPVTPDAKVWSGSLNVNDSVLMRINVTVAPTSYQKTIYVGAWTVFIDAGGVYQSLPSFQRDTVLNVNDQCNCMSAGIGHRSNAGINITKSVVSTACIPNTQHQDVTYEFNITAPSNNNVWMRNLKLIDDLTTGACGSFLGITTAPSIVSTNATSAPALNPSYNGSTVTDMFSGSFSNRLAANEFVRVRMTARYNTASMCTPNQFNTAEAQASHPSTTVFSATTANVLINKLVCCAMTAVLGAAQTICTGGTVTLSPTINTGTPSYNYNWSGSLGATASVNVSPTANTTYTVTVTDAVGCTASASQSITVIADPSVSVSGGGTVCEGGTTTLTANVTGGGGTTSYQWQRRIAPSGPWINVGTNTNTYTTDATLSTNSYDYQVIITQSQIGCNNTSTPLAANIASDPTVSVSSTSSTICAGGNTVLTAVPSGGTGSCGFQWQSNNGSGWTDISGATNSTYTTPALSSGTQYRAIYTCTASGCCN